MITRIYAHSAAERRHGSPNQAIDCSRALAVQQYLILRKIHGLSASNARDRLHQIMFIGVTSDRYVPSTTAVHRPVEAAFDPECDHSFLDEQQLQAWMDAPLSDEEAAEHEEGP